MAAAFAYLVLLCSLAGARIARDPDEPEPTLPVLRIVADSRAITGAAAPDPITQFAVAPTCVGPETVSFAHADAPDLKERLAFGPPVEPAGPLSAAAINGVLITRLCGGAETPGGPVRGPDRRLYAAIDAAVNGTDPNRELSWQEWASGVNRFITRDGQFLRSRVVTRTTLARTPTWGMQARPGGADPAVIKTHLVREDTSRYLILPVKARDGRTVTLTLRLRCGFQPVL